ncbi:MAG: hypothetical protein KKA67_09615 [Spirochaetes bacterium]|nr:hypothetical protein [Spirochaetota bacterium]MBU1079928.1 hypothetical protein [Spirochaetota bacterium]
MKPALGAIAFALTMLLASCNFNFLGDADLSVSEDALRVVESEIPGGVRYSYYDSSDTLQYYEDRYSADGRVTQSERHAANGDLRYAYLYRYDAGGNKILTAYYDSSKALRWFQAYSFAGDRLETIAEYDAASALQWSRRYAYGDGTSGPLGELVRSASFNAAGEPTAGSVYRYDGGRAFLMTAYGGVSVAAAGASVSGSAQASRSLGDFAEPTTPAYSVPAIPSDDAFAAIGVSSYACWLRDAYGETQVSLDSAWYPTRVVREDSRLPDGKDVSVTIEWDSNRRISRKKSYYGSTLAFDVAMSYTPEGYPLRASTSGAALLLPLDYALAYEAGRPVRLDVQSAGTTLQWFEYAYSGPPAPLSLEEARTVDPFAFLDGLATAGLKIRHYDGDDALVETIEFTAEGTGLRLNVYDASGVLNGYYLAAYSGDSLIASLSSYDSAGAKHWGYEYGYADAASLADAAGATLADFPELGRLSEAYITDDILDYAQGFVMDLLF